MAALRPFSKKYSQLQFVTEPLQRTAGRSRLADSGVMCSEGLDRADFVEKLTFASAEMTVPNSARAPFLLGFARLLRRRKDLSQFPEVLGGCGEQEFIICAAWTT